jgi:hypothetical protein
MKHESLSPCSEEPTSVPILSHIKPILPSGRAYLCACVRVDCLLCFDFIGNASGQQKGPGHTMDLYHQNLGVELQFTFGLSVLNFFLHFMLCPSQEDHLIVISGTLDLTTALTFGIVTRCSGCSLEHVLLLVSV